MYNWPALLKTFELKFQKTKRYSREKIALTKDRAVKICIVTRPYKGVIGAECLNMNGTVISLFCTHVSLQFFGPK